MDAREQIRNMMYMLMKRDIYKYLVANTKDSESSTMKADHHLALSYIYVAVRVGLIYTEHAPRVETNGHGMVYSMIHDATQEMTDFMDEVIGFPLDDPRPDYRTLSPKFFKEFVLLADMEWDRIEDNTNGPGIDWDGRWKNWNPLND